MNQTSLADIERDFHYPVVNVDHEFSDEKHAYVRATTVCQVREVLNRYMAIQYRSFEGPARQH